MAFIFELIKWLFFVLTIVVGMLAINGTQILSSLGFDQASLPVVQGILMPGYFVLWGIMVGYIISQLRVANYDEDVSAEVVQGVRTKSFLLGLFLGALFAIVYVFLTP